ncbi:PaaI family thioesterase [Pelotomaculum sp. FP]|uniref:PaaI family thioesterase n=1 Tax=Pelotomaculum sp. FP TaxID=261474 RepID=UPI00106654A8|nr:PaaI family thioesterase [Pelotomaculum sp. FP]
MAKMLDYLQKYVSGEVAAPPVAQLVGFRVTDVEEGKGTIEFEATKSHANPTGTLHGGILCVIGDSAMGLAYASALELDESFVTLELKINYLRPVWEGKLLATGRIVQKGKTIGLVEFDIIDDKEKLVARGSGTFMTLQGDKASGRLVNEVQAV